jgi:hypothetical protein
VIDEPVVIRVRRDVRPLVGIGPQIEYFRDSQIGEGIGPDVPKVSISAGLAARKTVHSDTTLCFAHQVHDRCGGSEAPFEFGV